MFRQNKTWVDHVMGAFTDPTYGKVRSLERDVQNAFDRADFVDDGLSESIGRLFELDKAQEQRIENLQALVAVLLDIVAENDLTNEKDLDRRLKEFAFENRDKK